MDLDNNVLQKLLCTPYSSWNNLKVQYNWKGVYNRTSLGIPLLGCWYSNATSLCLSRSFRIYIFGTWFRRECSSTVRNSLPILAGFYSRISLELRTSKGTQKLLSKISGVSWAYIVFKYRNWLFLYWLLTYTSFVI